MSETTSLSSTYLEPEPTDVPQARGDARAGRVGLPRVPRRSTAPRCDRILEAVVAAAVDNAQEYAEWAVAETGFGVVEHKRLKNEACSRGILDVYADPDFVTPRIDDELKIVEVPRPAGVVLALTPSTNPVSTVYFKILLAC